MKPFNSYFTLFGNDVMLSTKRSHLQNKNVIDLLNDMRTPLFSDYDNCIIKLSPHKDFPFYNYDITKHFWEHYKPCLENYRDQQNLIAKLIIKDSAKYL